MNPLRVLTIAKRTVPYFKIAFLALVFLLETSISHAGEIIRPNVELALSTMMSTGETPSYISVSPYSFSLDHTAHSISITVSSNVSYWYSDNKTWISPQGSNTFSIQENNSGADRSGTITYKYGGIIEEIIIQQSRNSAIQDITLGTGSLVSDSYNDSELTPFGTYWEDNRTQYLVKAEELISLGFSAGNIYSLAFNVASNGGKNLDYMEVNIGTTNIVELTDYANIGMSTVYSGSRTISTGWNTINFDAPFFWNGASNIILQVCFDNNDNNNNTTIYYSNTSFASTFGEYCNGVTGCSPNYFLYEGSVNRRPNMKFAIEPTGGVYYPGFTKLSPTHDVIPSINKNYIQSIEPREPQQIYSGHNVNIDAIETIQYFDGLGRPIQTVSVKASPTGKDIIHPIVYDDFGRQSYQLLPYTSLTSGAYRANAACSPDDAGYSTTEQYQFYQGTSFDHYGTDKTYPYVETVFENSPLNRVFEQGAPGEDWQIGTIQTDGRSDGHTVKTYFGTNTDSYVKMWEADATLTGITQNGTYDAGEFYVTELQDENYDGGNGGGITLKYKDKLGQVVLKETRLVNDDLTISWLQTYYVYDDYGLLRCVIPPKAAAKTSGIIDQELCYFYRYDERKRMIEKQLPGAEPVYMVYDIRDRLVATQDGNMRKNADGTDKTNKEWLFIKYDAYNRPIMTGILHNGDLTGVTTRDSLQSFVYTYTGDSLYEVRTSSNDIHGYSDNSFPQGQSESEFLTITYYDTYEDFPLGFDAGGYSISGISGLFSITQSDFEASATGKTIGLVTGSKVRNLSTGDFYFTASYYDDKYRPIQIVSQNQLGGTDRVSSRYNFIGEVLASVTEHYDGTYTTLIGERFVYDHSGRLMETWHQASGQPDEILLTANIYNELGQLVKKYTHGTEDGSGNTEAIQKTDYAYNIRGWMTSINDVSDLKPTTENDMFAMNLHYNDITDLTNLSPQSQFNGNISAIDWVDKQSGNIKGYGFQYDELNRLVQADFETYNGSVWTNTNSYDVNQLSYDENGNIKSLLRYGADNSNSIDHLSYYYKNGGNQLLRVEDYRLIGVDAGFIDGTDITADDYTYDGNGNMITDYNKGISTPISYNYLNLPQNITHNQGITQYVYDAGGRKLSHSVGTTITEYIGNFVYEDGSLKYILTSEGRALPKTGGGFEYEYHMKDHLGNTRVAYSENGAIDQVSDYYPFGMRHEPFIKEDTDQKYLYNGKELQEELGWYDYGFRFYDPALGRFPSLDPIADEFHWVSPYNYAENSPIANIDWWGLQAVLAIHGVGAGDEKTFKMRAKNLSNRVPRSSTEAMSSGKDFLNVLSVATKSEGSIQGFTTFSHGGPAAIVLESGSGFYTQDGIGMGGKSGERFLSDLGNKIKEGAIKFEENATVIFGGCSNGDTDSGFGLAQNFTELTGVTSIAPDGRVSPEIVDGKETGRMFAFEGTFYKFELQEDGTVKKSALGQIIDPANYMTVTPSTSRLEPIAPQIIPTATEELELDL